MGKSTLDFDSKFPIDPEAKTIVLVGEMGNGKIATRNSFTGADVFDSIHSSGGVAATCQMHRADGQILNVIDTTGLFNSSSDPKKKINEIANCINMAKNGIHAVVTLLSLRTCFSLEEASAIETLRKFFGDKIGDYMILVFTNGVVLGEISFDDLLARYCPEHMVKTIRMCGNRYVLFDQWTEDEVKKSEQLKKLLHLVDTVVDNNDGVPYSNELFIGSPDISENGLNKVYEEQMAGFLQKIASKHLEMGLMLEKQMLDKQNALRQRAEALVAKLKLKKFNVERGKFQTESSEISKFNKADGDQLLDMESSHREKTRKLEKQLEDVQVARMQAEAAQMKANDEISKLREDLERAQRETRELRKTLRETQELNKMIQEKKTNGCAISEITSAIEHKEIDSKLHEMSLWLENQLAEKFGRMQAEDKAEWKSADDIRKLWEDTLKKIQLMLGEENQEKNDCSVSEITPAMELQYESILRERILQFGELLADEKITRLLAEKKVQETEKKLNDEISRLREDLERAQKSKRRKTTAYLN